METLNCPFEIKEADDAGKFSGYAAVFDNVDLGNDVIEKGAFKKFKYTRDKKNTCSFVSRFKVTCRKSRC